MKSGGCWLCWHPRLIGLLLGTFGSILATLGLSLYDWDLLTPPEYAGLSNYAGLPGDRMFVKSLWNTVAFAALYVPLTMVLSLTVAMALNRRVRGESLFRVLYFLPVVSSPTAVGLLWTWIYAEDHGALNELIGLFGADPVRWLGSEMVLYSVVIANVWGAIGEGMIVFLAGLQAIPKEHYEVARIDGATVWQRLRYRHPARADAQLVLPGGAGHDPCLSGLRLHLHPDPDRERQLQSCRRWSSRSTGPGSGSSGWATRRRRQWC